MPAGTTTERKTTATTARTTSGAMASGRLLDGGEQLPVEPKIAGLLHEFGAQPGRTMVSHHPAALVLSDEFVDEQVLHHDHVAFHADHFGHMGDAARAVA